MACALVLLSTLVSSACGADSAVDAASVPAVAQTAEPSAGPAAPTGGENAPIITASIDLKFVEHADDVLAIEHACTGEALTRFAATEGGFVRGLVPMLQQERRIRRLPLDDAYSLSRDTQGRLYLIDPSAGTRVDIEAFGPDAVLVFDSFLPVSPAAGPTS